MCLATAAPVRPCEIRALSAPPAEPGDQSRRPKSLAPMENTPAIVAEERLASAPKAFGVCSPRHRHRAAPAIPDRLSGQPRGSGPFETPSTSARAERLSRPSDGTTPAFQISTLSIWQVTMVGSFYAPRFPDLVPERSELANEVSGCSLFPAPCSPLQARRSRRWRTRLLRPYWRRSWRKAIRRARAHASICSATAGPPVLSVSMVNADCSRTA